MLYIDNRFSIQHTGEQQHDRGSLSQCGRLARLLCWLPLCLLPATGGLASDNAEAGFRLSVRPSICVSYDGAVPCTMAMEVSWEGNRAVDVCLHAAADDPLHCWQASRSGRVELTHADTVDVLYQLIEQEGQAVLAEAEIKVINRDLRSSRKRRRHVWSIL